MIFEQTEQAVTLSSVLLLNTMIVPFCTMYRPTFPTTVRVTKANTIFIYLFFFFELFSHVYGGLFLTLNKKGNCKFVSHNTDFFSHNCKFYSQFHRQGLS